MPYESRKNNNNMPSNSIGSNNTSLPSAKDRERVARENASTKATKTAAKAAGAYFGGPLGSKAVDMASKTKAGQNLLNKGGQALNNIPGMGRAAKRLDDSGALDMADKVLDAGLKNKNMAKKDGGVKALPSSASNDKQETDLNKDNASNSNNHNNTPNIAGLGPYVKNDYSKENLKEKEQEEQAEKRKVKNSIFFAGSVVLQAVLILILPVIVVVAVIAAVIGGISNGIGEFADAFGVSMAAGEETGDIEYEAQNEEAKDFYERINDIKLEYQASGKTVDVLKVAAVFHILSDNGADMTYENMTDDKIKEIVDAMYSGNSYNEDTFRQNLITDLIPTYLPNSTDGEREQMTDDIFDYIERYYSLIGKETSVACASLGSCVYDIKGFYISSSGNIAKNMQISDLQVRLMECGSPYGMGNYNTPIDQDLVPFEDYIIGVSYAEIGTDFPDEAVKAQMVVSRSYALARPTAMGNALGKKLEQENGQWILQISSCVADQVFCNVDEGCSFMGGGDGQGGVVRSGHIPGAERYRDPLPADHRLRVLGSEVQGEVLVNNQGNIISAGFLSTEQNIFKNLANQGLNYKQILLQVYNQGTRNYGAADIQKASCNDGNAVGCVGSASTGPFAGWKQYSGPWVSVQLGSSGQTIKQAGCLVTSIAMLVAKSGVQTNISDFNPGTFVEYLSSHGGFVGANYVWASVEQVAPDFKYQGSVSVLGQSKAEKLNTLKGLITQGYYIVAEVKGNTGQHWVAIDGLSGDNILMMDPGSESTDMWGQYPWNNTSRFAYFKVS